MKYQFIENETLLDEADFDNCVVYLMNKTNSECELDSKVIVNEVSESFEPDTVKFPQMMTFANEHYLANCTKEEVNIDEEGNEYTSTVFTEPFEYEVITDDESKYTFTSYVCDRECIKTVQ